MSRLRTDLIHGRNNFRMSDCAGTCVEGKIKNELFETSSIDHKGFENKI